MKRVGLLIIALALGLFVPSDSAVRSQAEVPGRRIKFHIVTIEEKGAERTVVSESVVDGPINSDFNVSLEGARFRMKARFLTDLIRPDALRVRTKLNTRRLYGSSERNLPLYEEDEQSQSLELNFDEAVVLLPFGRTGGDHRLKIEITPSYSDQPATSATGQVRPLEINILKASPGGIISLEAQNIPHNFVCDVTLLENGHEVAEGTAPVLLEEPQQITLRARNGARAEPQSQPITVDLTVERYARSRPVDQVSFRFDVRRSNTTGDQVLARNWAGVAGLQSSLDYRLDGLATNGTKKYELRFSFRLAPGERAD